MATVKTKTKCFTCEKDKITYECKGCLRSFCFDHLGDHRKELSQTLNDVEDHRNLFKQTLDQYQTNSVQNSLLQQTNQWEDDSIRLIQQTAQDTRELIHKNTNQHVSIIQNNLNKLTDQIKELRSDNDFDEGHLNELKIDLEKLEKQLHQPIDIRIEEDSTLIKKITIVNSSHSQIKIRRTLPVDMKWGSNAVTIAGGNGTGAKLDQFSNPFGICIDNNQTIYMADQNNHRIVEYKKDATIGQVVVGGNGSGSETNRLTTPINVIIDYQNDAFIIADRGNKRVVRWPRRNDQNGEIIISNVKCTGLFLDKSNNLYVCDEERNEVKKWKVGDIDGVLVAGGNGRGANFNQLHQPFCIFVDQHESIYVSDYGNDRIIKWMKGAKQGIIVAGGQGKGSGLTQLSSPFGIFVDQQETVYIADCGNSRVVRWLKGAKQGEVILGGNGQFNRPVDLLCDEENHLYVVDQSNQRVQKFISY